ncbi:MAG: sugar phosphate isomerase/epimerase [Phycisphaerae bacterium]|nr:sugar phosphate isomerase/epimerase [Phycisphaerae bacterium]
MMYAHEMTEKKHNLMLVLMLCLISIAAAAVAGDKPAAAFDLFAFDNYMMKGEYTQAQVCADTLKELGYDGMSYHGTKDIMKTIEIFKDAGLKLFITYLGVNIDETIAARQYDPNLKDAIKQLKGTDTMIWLYLTSKKYKHASEQGDAAAVKIIRDIADAAQESGLKIVLYPHVGCYSESFADTLRIARKVNRRNVGVSFNVCHWLKVDGDVDYLPILKESLPYLFVVTTNGGETGDTKKMGWDKLIQTLDKGSFDNYKLLKYLKDIGYKGPIGLQGYAIKGDPKQNLANSMKAWLEINEKLTKESAVKK